MSNDDRDENLRRAFGAVQEQLDAFTIPDTSVAPVDAIRQVIEHEERMAAVWAKHSALARDRAARYRITLADMLRRAQHVEEPADGDDTTAPEPQRGDLSTLGGCEGGVTAEPEQDPGLGDGDGGAATNVVEIHPDIMAAALDHLFMAMAKDRVRHMGLDGLIPLDEADQ